MQIHFQQHFSVWIDLSVYWSYMHMLKNDVSNSRLILTYIEIPYQSEDVRTARSLRRKSLAWGRHKMAPLASDWLVQCWWHWVPPISETQTVTWVKSQTACVPWGSTRTKSMASNRRRYRRPADSGGPSLVRWETTPQYFLPRLLAWLPQPGNGPGCMNRYM